MIRTYDFVKCMVRKNDFENYLALRDDIVKCVVVKSDFVNCDT